MARKKPDTLAQEVAMALAAGMSYGKWKALQAIVTVQKELPEGWKICPQCGKPLKSSCGKRFCDIDCRTKAYAPKARECNRRNYLRKKGLIE
jgi:hypothetical protein